MRYSEILQGLYGNDLNKIISILQKSIYSANIDKKKDGVIAIHTGFSFTTHKEKLMEILLGFSETSDEIIIIRQIRPDFVYRKIPLLNGLRMAGEKDYFDQFYPLILAEICREKGLYKYFEIKDPLKYSDMNFITEVESKDSNEVIKSIKVTENDELIDFPLQRKCETKIYFDGKNFSKYILRENNYQDDNQDDDYEKPQSYESWLRSEFGDDAETAYWNNE